MHDLWLSNVDPPPKHTCTQWQSSYLLFELKVLCDDEHVWFILGSITLLQHVVDHVTGLLARAAHLLRVGRGGGGGGGGSGRWEGRGGGGDEEREGKGGGRGWGNGGGGEGRREDGRNGDGTNPDHNTV